jgi:hypothetical protein
VAGEANCLKIDYVNDKEVSRDPNTIGENIITKSPDSACNGEKMDSKGYTLLCKQNLARSYSKANSFLQVAAMVRNARFTVSGPFDGIKLGKPFNLKIGPGTFKGQADYSIVMTAASYNDKHTFGVLKQTGGVNGAEIAVTREDWGADWMKAHVPSKTLTIDVVMVATPKDGSASFLKRVMIPILPPRLAMLCGKKERAFRKDQTIACNVQFWNPLPYPLKKAVMSFSISGQASQGEKTIEQQNLTIEPAPVQETDAVDVDPTSRSTFKAKFKLNGATGSQLIVAKLSSDELDGVSGLMDITIRE